MSIPPDREAVRLSVLTSKDRWHTANDRIEDILERATAAHNRGEHADAAAELGELASAWDSMNVGAEALLDDETDEPSVRHVARWQALCERAETLADRFGGVLLKGGPCDGG